MTLQEMLEKMAQGYEDDPAESGDPAIECNRCTVCGECEDEHTVLNEAGQCPECETAIKNGYRIMRLAGRCANGAERDGGTRWHAVPVNSNGKIVAGMAKCGATPGRRSAGWSEWYSDDREVTCPRCLKKLQS